MMKSAVKKQNEEEKKKFHITEEKRRKDASIDPCMTFLNHPEGKIYRVKSNVVTI